MRFLLNCTKPVIIADKVERIDEVSYIYDNMTSEIFDYKNKLVNIKPDKKEPVKKKRAKNENS